MNSSTKLSEIAQFLDQHTFEHPQPGLLAGESGVILFLLHYARHTGDADLMGRAVERIEMLLEQVDTDRTRFTFCDGLAGLGWLIEYAEQKGWLECNTNEVLGEVDPYLYSIMLGAAGIGNYDFLHGALGVGFYFTYRARKNELARTYVDELVDVLRSKAVVEPDGSMKWPAWDLLKGEVTPGDFNMGLSHGIPGILAFLTKAYHTSAFPEKVYGMIAQTSRFIVKNRLDPARQGSYFPYSVTGSAEATACSRLAWCYGDLGVGCALWQAADILNDGALQELVRQVMLHAAGRRTPADTNIVDAGLCHGTAGAAHIFRRFYGQTREPALLEAARFWTDHTLQSARFADGYAGYKAYMPTETGDGWHPASSFLEGVAGIGLGLLYQQSPEDPSWEEALLIR